MTIKEAIVLGRTKLANSGIHRPLLEAEILISYQQEMDRVSLILNENKKIDDIDGYLSLIDRRCNQEPIEYITNRAGFYGMNFIVHKGVLIPRPETEILVDKVSQIIEKNSIEYIAEVGVGSGIISVTLALKFPHLKIVATDISDKAIENTKANIEKFKVDNIELKHCSMLDGVDSKIELLVSNPPYISPDVSLEKCVQEYEPHTALFADDRGCLMLKELIDLSIDKEIAFLACEMGYDQKDELSKYLQSKGIKEYSFYKDYAGLDRGFTAKIFVS